MYLVRQVYVVHGLYADLLRLVLLRHPDLVHGIFPFFVILQSRREVSVGGVPRRSARSPSHAHVVDDSVVGESPRPRRLFALKRRSLSVELRLGRSLKDVADHSVVLGSAYAHLVSLSLLYPDAVASCHYLGALFAVLRCPNRKIKRKSKISLRCVTNE